MGRYRKIDTRIWNDLKFRALSDDGKFAFLFVLTHPAMTGLGAMRGTFAGLASEIGWTVERFAKGFGEACARGMLESEGKASFIGAPNFCRYNLPESPNVIRGWRAGLDLIPECGLRDKQIQRARLHLEALGQAFRKAFDEAFAHPCPHPEPEQEPQPQPEPEQKGDPAGAGSGDFARATSPAATTTESAIVLTFPCDGPIREWHLHRSKIDEYRMSYPELDVEAALRAARQWIADNQSCRKTARGMLRFCNGWLTRAQDRGQHRRGAHPTTNGSVQGQTKYHQQQQALARALSRQQTSYAGSES